MEERRCKYRKWSIRGLWIVLVFWLITGVAAEESVIKERDVMQAQWRLIVFLVGIVQILVGFIYIAGITSLKTSIRKLFKLTEDLAKDKLDKTDHDRICKTAKET